MAIKHQAFDDIMIGKIDGIIKDCPICTVVKMKESTHPAERSNPLSKVLQLLQVDRAGPYEPTCGGKTSYQVIIDAATAYSGVDLTKQKSEGPKQIMDYVTLIENGTKEKVKAI